MTDLRQIAIAAAVAILSAVLVALLIDVIYPEPKYSDYCKNAFEPRPAIQAPVDCANYGISEEEQKCTEDGGLVKYKYDEKSCPLFDKCDFCNKDYDAARKIYSRNVFLTAGIIGVTAIFAGTLWGIEFLASGLMFGGIILLFYATVRYFGEADKLLRVIIIFAELLLVLWIGYKKLYKKTTRRKKIMSF